MKDCFLSIDVGTTSTKAFIYNINGQQLKSSQSENTLIFPCSGWVEQCPHELFKNVLCCLEELAQFYQMVQACGITNQRETIVAFRKSTGETIGNAISWMDTRTSVIVNQFNTENDSETISLYEDQTGLKVSTFFSAFKIKWIIENHFIDGQIPEDLAFCTLDSWILWKLTKGQSFLTDPSNASRTFLYDLKLNDWSETLLEKFSIKREWLPVIKHQFDSEPVYGKIDVSFPFKDTEITALIGDQQSSLIGHWGKEFYGNSKCTFGTGAFFLRSLKDELLAMRKSGCLLTMIAFGHFAEEYPIVCAGSLIEWLKNSLKFFECREELNSLNLTSSKSPSDSVYFNPSLSGSLFPYWDPSLRGSFNNISLQNDKIDFILAVFESIAYSVKLIVSNLSIKVLSVDGGMCGNLGFCKLLADICNCDIRVLEDSNATGFGAAVLASNFAISTDNLDYKIISPSPDQETINFYKEKNCFFGIEIDGISWIDKDSSSRIIENSPASRNIKLVAGELVAVCGPTGSGKSALVHLLAGSDISSKKKVEIKGKIRIISDESGVLKKARCNKCWYSHVRLVPQNDMFIPSLKSKQLLKVSLKLQGRIYIGETCESLLNLMKINDSLSTRSMAQFTRGTDIDYRGNLKKLAIVDAMTSRPHVLVVDEPAYFTDLHVLSDITRGLKTYANSVNQSSWRCQNCNTHFSNERSCVVFVLNSMFLALNHHDGILDRFDKIILLSMSRQIVFFGTLKEAVETLGRGSVSRLLESLDDLCLDKQTSPDATDAAYTRKSNLRPDYRVQFYSQLSILFQRHLYQLKNCPKQVFRVVIQRILLFIVLSFIFAAPNSRSSFIGIFFFLPINQTANVILYTATEGFAPDELNIIERARFHKLYMTFSLLIAKLLVLIPVNVFPALIYAPAVYFIADFQVDSSFIMFYLANILHIMCTVPAGIFIASSSKDPFIRDLWLFGVTTLFVTFGGIHKAANFQITWILRWLQFISPTYYLFIILLQLEYTQDEISGLLSLGTVILSIGEAFGALAVLGLLFTVLAFISLSMTTRPCRILF